MYKPEYVKSIVFDNKQIVSAIAKAGQWLTNRFKTAEKPPIIVCILKGALQFYSHLIENVELEIVEDFTTLNSYRGTTQDKDPLKTITNLSQTLTNRDVVIVEDVSDTANTLTALINNIKNQKPKSITTIVLVDKPDCRVKPFIPDYACFSIKGNAWLVGYGMDCSELGRNLPYLAEFNKEFLK